MATRTAEEFIAEYDALKDGIAKVIGEVKPCIATMIAVSCEAILSGARQDPTSVKDILDQVEKLKDLIASLKPQTTVN